MSKEFASEYTRVVAVLPRFGTALESLIPDLLKTRNIKFHSVKSRVKSEESATTKVARKAADSGEPRSLDSLTDLLGVRIITYFQDEVEAVARLITDEFAIDEENTIDKGAALDADRFGYVSMHYVAELRQSRAELAEYQPYAGIKFEVQIRSILQHAWAEIEHDLGYKADAVPRAVRRRFSRLAGLLELADDEFIGIREEISAHQKVARKTIQQGALAIEIDQDSLSAFVQSRQQIRELDRAIARATNDTLQSRIDEEFMGRQATQLTGLGFASIEELSDYLEEEWEQLKRFIYALLSRTEHRPRNKRLPVPMGIALYYAGLLRRAQGLRTGSNDGPANAGIGADFLLRSLESAESGSQPLPGAETLAAEPRGGDVAPRPGRRSR